MIAVAWWYTPATKTRGEDGLETFHSWTVHNNQEEINTYWKHAYSDYPKFYADPDNPHKIEGKIHLKNKTVSYSVCHTISIEDEDIKEEACLQILQRGGYITDEREPRWMKLKL